MKHLRKLLLLICIGSFGTISAQSIFISTVNISGGTASKTDFNLEWNVGESVLVNTAQNANIMLTQGLLQGFIANKPEFLSIPNWTTDEVKIYPNPATDHFFLNVLSPVNGVVQWKLADLRGNRIKQQEFNYYGNGNITKIDVSNLPAGTYTLWLVIKSLPPFVNYNLKASGYQIVKLHN